MSFVFSSFASSFVDSFVRSLVSSFVRLLFSNWCARRRRKKLRAGEPPNLLSRLRGCMDRAIQAFIGLQCRDLIRGSGSP